MQCRCITVIRFLPLNRLRHLAESHPDRWYRYRNIQNYKKSVAALAAFLGSRPQDLVLVENVTTALNTVVQSLKLTREDTILITSLSYNAVQVLAKAVADDNNGPKVQTLQLDLPLDKGKIINAYKKHFEKSPNIKIAILDHITSPTAIVMPVKELVSLCRERGVLTLVDGAHACGQLPLNLQELGADFYGGNVHKWLFTPRGCGYLWVDPRHQEMIRPAVVSHFHGNRLHYDFCVRGTRDDTPYHTIPTAIDFFNRLGGLEAIHKYVGSLLDEAVSLLTRAWGTRKMDVPGELEAPYMKVISLPALPNFPVSYLGGGALEKALYERFNIQTQCREQDGELTIRLCAHVYSCMDDFHHLNNAIQELMKEPVAPSVTDMGYVSPIMHWDLSILNDFNKLSLTTDE